ncbi:TIGR04211 family SH3 domain-containing protein [Pelovirga terrestris]|uniref:TIGR04211 family SH3 domain-containing protein n=1 Tax=Pelovirga terrestris TaxID=2771352 RepID=A0A8J6QMY7_9BACT|nr:TIGR04211 family SH3 domain-containing protein [Pelovirga terrestris]MBD1401689.1 TIGR04211 family SH3 domain-containing protein [Pelovirga terrestris]
MKFKLLFLVSLLATLLAGTAMAETRYVSDTLLVTVRSNTTNDYQVLARLLSNTPVTILGEQGSFYRLRTVDGTEGYVQKQYITGELPKTLIIDQLQKHIAALEEGNRQLQARYTELQESNGDAAETTNLVVQLEETRTQLKQVTEQYENLRENSADVLTLYENNQLLEEQNQSLNREVQVLREENSSFHRSNMIQWFLAGAGVFLGGWFIGKISRQKTRSFSR